ncbi:MAG: fibronectin type III domain-containing protein [Patescibacteria group bacterium]|jgi:hypothetical protein|nr:fibronectin type III domain-containing protein [Patescibacteria group bacterium]
MLNNIRKKNSPPNKLLKIYLKGFFVFGLFFVLVLGFSPIDFLQRYIGAFGGEMRAVSFYASSGNTSVQSEDYSLGWWGGENVLNEPQISPNGRLSSFSDTNSSFYNGGDFSLLISDFTLKGVSLPSQTEPEVEFMEINEDSSEDSFLEDGLTEQGGEERAHDESETSTTTDATSTDILSKKTLVNIANAQEDSDLSVLGEFDSAKIMISFALGSLEADSSGGGAIVPVEIATSTASSSDDEIESNEDEIDENVIASSSDELGDDSSEKDTPEEQTLEEQTPEEQTLEEIIKEDDEEIIQDVEIIIEEEDISEDFEQSVEIIENEEEASVIKIKEEEKTEEEVEDIVEEIVAPVVSEPDPEVENSDGDIISKIFSVKNAIAQSDSPKFAIWYSVMSETGDASTSASTTGREIWEKLDTVYDDDLSNYLNDGFFSYDAPFLESWTDLENLKIKIEGLADEQADFVLYIDSIWVDIEYEKDPNTPELPEEKELRWENMLEFLSDQKVFTFDEKGEFRFKYNKNKKTLSESFGLSGYWDSVDIEVEIEDFKGDILELPLIIVFEEDGEFSITLPSLPRKFRPGEYRIKFTIIDSSGAETEEFVLEESFSWGVLAINTDKSIYKIGDESAFIQMAVLDEGGHTLCGADLSLEIISPDGEVRIFDTSNDTIIQNEFCEPENVITSPDYYTYFQLAGVGTYELKLKAITENGVKEITDSFRVVEETSFDISRIGPTRIYPLANYEMKINILASEDFEGNFYEYVPDGFYIVNQTLKIKKASTTDFVLYNSQVSSSTEEYIFDEFEINDEKELSWKNLLIEDGDELEAVYLFDAPNVSPELYLLGPASIATTTEDRQWQIASDAITTYPGTAGINVNWTDPTFAWDSSNNTYATKAIPKKNVDDSANYLLVTSNTATDIGGIISSVKIAVEGFVENTAITTYVVPVLGGADGGIYTITGTTMGTTDNDVPVYLDITSEIGTWTWADIIGMDIRLYGQNSSNPTDYTLSIDQINILVDYTTNNLPTGSFTGASQKVDSSGVIDLSIQADDLDDDPLRAKIEYVSGATCDFATPLDPYLDETDTNATSTFGDAKINNNEDYQVGSSTGYIITTSGANSVYFDWLSTPALDGADGTYCLRLTANDLVEDQAILATTTVDIDNKNPTAPGEFTFSSHTKDSLTLSYGATSSDTNFSDYKIFWKIYDGTAPDEGDNEINSSGDTNLGAIDFNGIATTSITGLSENIQYSVSIWAYDIYGHSASSTYTSFYTNQTPTSSFNSAVQRTDGTGVVDISLDVNDGDNDNSIARIDYVLGAACNFSTPLDPTIDETQSNISSTYGVPTIENDNIYQVGAVDWWITTPDVNTLQFDWFGQTDLPLGEATYCLQFTMNDIADDQNTPATTTLTIDNAAPSPPGQLTSGEVTGSTIKLIFGATSTDSNFSHYEIHYKEGTTGVVITDPEHINTDLSDINYNGTSSTTVGSLNLNTDYVFNIWAYDTYGNIIASTETTAKTNSSITNDSLTFTNPDTLNQLIADGTSEWNFRALVSDLGGYAGLDTVLLRLADSADNVSPFGNLEFSWTEATALFSETGADVNGAVVISPNSTSTCSVNTCTIDFTLIFNHNFASSTTDYSAELYSTNDLASFDGDSYLDLYKVDLYRIEQVHYRWRNDDGGE